MNVLLVHNVADVYGASRSLLRWATRLVQEGHRVRVVLPAEGVLSQRLQAVGAVLILDQHLPVLHRNRLRHPGAILALGLDYRRSRHRAGRLLKEDPPDLVHTNTCTILPSWGRAACAVGIPHITHIRESFHDFGPLWRIFQWILGRCSDRLVAVSAAMAEQVSPALRNRVVVLHNGFPQKEFEPVSEDRIAAFIRRWSVVGFERVGVVGRIKLGRKGQDIFVQAASRLARQFPQARFLIVGSPFPGNEDQLRRLTLLIDALGIKDRVILTGEVEDIPAVFSALDVVVLPSGTPEPFGGVVIEAMALGRPVVGTAIGGTPEQIQDGVTGFLVPPNDPDALAEAVRELLADPVRREEMGRQGRRRFLEAFEFEPFYVRMMNVYRVLLNRSRG